MKSVLDRDSMSVRFRNDAAHGGDFLADARLFEKKLRFDDDVFIQLYVLGWNRAPAYRDEPEVVAVLNQHTGAVVNNSLFPQRS